RAFDPGLPEISGFREWARHSIGLGINSRPSYRYAEGEGQEFSLKIQCDRSLDGERRVVSFQGER
ncbi:hypothetical protein, partial [Rhizobium leguminosarum]|uniref:hypothetical protein n=1 Tax=Rhizobium leguminosarum TaxID=384 RepID=UPI00197CC732